MTAAQFILAYPQFKVTDSSVIAAAVATATAAVSADRWGANFDLAFGLYAAHTTVTILRRQAAGPLGGAGAGDATSKTVGSVTVQRSAQLLQAQMRNPLYRTEYGQEYMHLLSITFGGTTLAAPQDSADPCEVPY